MPLVFVFSIVFVIFSFNDDGKDVRYLSNLIGFSYLCRLNMHVFDDEWDLILSPLINKDSFSLTVLIWVYMR